jgi:hypothetical protein
VLFEEAVARIVSDPDERIALISPNEVVIRT